MRDKTPHRSLALTISVALAACSPSSDDSSQPASTEAPIAVEPDGGIGDGATPLPSPTVAEAIPERFLGVWDNVEGTCEPVSESRLEIGPKSIGFYESQGEVTRVEVDSLDRIVVSLAMEGEGERWQTAQMYTLSDNGARLTASSVGDEQFEPLERKKCPVEGE